MEHKDFVSENFSSALKQYGIIADKNKLDLFRKYYELLLRWNSKINITSITEKEQVYFKHFLDSISSCRYINYGSQKVVDVGTGGGFPGLPIKIIFSNIKLSFVDSSSKKMNVLREICKELGIFDCEFIVDNVENIARNDKYRESFDIATSRAVASMSVLLEYTIPLLKVNGKSIFYKGPSVEKEVENSINALELLNCKIIENADFIIPFTDENRKIIAVEKKGKTDDKYPRRVGIPRKRPL